MNDLNSLWLRSFTVLCEERHFTRAAARLAMTQPGMSQHIARLEQQLGAALIDREAPGFVLTAAGEKTLAMARARWREEEAFIASLDDDDPDRGTVSVAGSGSFAMLLYPALMEWMGAAPELSIRLTAAPEESVLAGVLAGTFDAGVVAGAAPHPRLTAQPLGAEPLDLILPASHAGRWPEFATLQALGMIQHPDAGAYADAVFGTHFAAEYHGADRLHIRSFVNQIGQIPEPVARGLGYAILPRSGVLAFAGRDRLAIAPCPQPTVLDLQLVQRKRGPRPARIDKLIALIRQVAEGLGGARPDSAAPEQAEGGTGGG